jgi:ABC-2 type transport system ATP-binding protein
MNDHAHDAPRADRAVAAIEIRGLTKSFDGTRVLNGLTFAVPHGQVIGYIGPNGAGKSTTVKILVGMLGDFAGDVRVAGIDVREEPVALKHRIGYVPENAILYEALTAGETLELVGRLHGLSDAEIARRIPELFRAFDLKERVASRLGSFSKGMRQKVLLAAALMHDPEVLFLDEPLSGLDVGSTILVKALIRALAARGKTVFYCSHVMDVVERVCDRIVILDHGVIVADGSFEELSRDRTGGSLERIFAELTRSGGEEEKVSQLLESMSRRGEHGASR